MFSRPGRICFCGFAALVTSADGTNLALLLIAGRDSGSSSYDLLQPGNGNQERERHKHGERLPRPNLRRTKPFRRILQASPTKRIILWSGLILSRRTMLPQTVPCTAKRVLADSAGSQHTRH